MFTERAKPGHVGACAELLAAAWLLEQGYEVFRNVSPNGPADLVAWKIETGEVFAVDVTSTMNAANTKYHSLPKSIRVLVVQSDQIMFYTPDAEAAGFSADKNDRSGKPRDPLVTMPTLDEIRIWRARKGGRQRQKAFSATTPIYIDPESELFNVVSQSK